MEVRGPTERTRRKSDENGKSGLKAANIRDVLKEGGNERAVAEERREIPEKERGVEGNLENEVADERVIARKRKEKVERKK